MLICRETQIGYITMLKSGGCNIVTLRKIQSTMDKYSGSKEFYINRYFLGWKRAFLKIKLRNGKLFKKSQKVGGTKFFSKRSTSKRFIEAT